MASEWQRVVSTTISKYIRKEERNVKRHRVLLAALEKKGRITYNHSGKDIDWGVDFDRRSLTPHSDFMEFNVDRFNRHKRATLDWRSYILWDAIGWKEKKMNRGREALVNVAATMGEKLVDDFKELFPDELYKDGNASGNENRVHGLESFFGDTDAVVTNSHAAAPSDTYGGLSTVLGTYGGTWNAGGDLDSAWPFGTGSYAYDFWSPIVVDYSNTGWNASGQTWFDTCLEALRYGKQACLRNNSKGNMLDFWLLDNSMYREFLNRIEDKERIQVNSGKRDNMVTELGFESVTYDGTPVTFEYGIPADSGDGSAVGYGLNLDKMELCCLTDNLIEVDEDYAVTNRLGDAIVVVFGGNLKTVSPRYHVKLRQLT